MVGVSEFIVLCGGEEEAISEGSIMGSFGVIRHLNAFSCEQGSVGVVRETSGP